MSPATGPSSPALTVPDRELGAVVDRLVRDVAGFPTSGVTVKELRSPGGRTALGDHPVRAIRVLMTSAE